MRRRVWYLILFVFLSVILVSALSQVAGAQKRSRRISRRGSAADPINRKRTTILSADLPACSPDGTNLAFIQFVNKPDRSSPFLNRSQFRLCIVDVNRTSSFCFPGLLTSSTPNAEAFSVEPVRPTFTPDGRKILFGAKASKGYCSSILISNLDGSDLERLSACDSLPQLFSNLLLPDTKHIAFRSVMSAIFVIDFQGSVVAKLRPSDQEVLRMRASTSLQMDKTSYTRLGIIRQIESSFILENLNSGRRSTLVEFNRELGPSGWTFPSFSPNGKEVVFSAPVEPVIPGPYGSAYYHEIFTVSMYGRPANETQPR